MVVKRVPRGLGNRHCAMKWLFCGYAIDLFRIGVLQTASRDDRAGGNGNAADHPVLHREARHGFHRGLAAQHFLDEFGMQAAYAHAIGAGSRFFSCGDASLLLPVRDSPCNLATAARNSSSVCAPSRMARL